MDAVIPAAAPPAHDGLTGRQREVVRLLYRHQAAGRLPTFGELMAPLGIASKNGLTSHLAALLRKGWVRRVPVATAYHFPYALAGLVLTPAFAGPEGARRRAVEGDA